MFFISRSSSCSVIHVNEDNKIYAKERLVSVIVVVVVVVVVFFCSLLKSGWPCDLSPKLVGASNSNFHPVLHEGVDVLTFVGTICSEPKFLGCIDNQIFLPMVLR